LFERETRQFIVYLRYTSYWRDKVKGRQHATFGPLEGLLMHDLSEAEGTGCGEEDDEDGLILNADDDNLLVHEPEPPMQDLLAELDDALASVGGDRPGEITSEA
jgi:hypothetical protein